MSLSRGPYFCFKVRVAYRRGICGERVEQCLKCQRKGAMMRTPPHLDIRLPDLEEE